jgi:peptidoglycan/LPS O-acetylase OafA/YrhL
MKLTYRPEIDGLRAIAVSAVILYHAQITILGHQPFKGGFIGVDIFFVISGYLITSIILKELVTDGTFSFKYFYERRVRRILPALLFVMLVSLPFAWMYLLPSSFVDFSKSILYSLGFSSNFYFWYSGEQYGAESGLLKPFLHTWSLSVEEQFYILFPIVLLITFKYFRKYLIHTLILGFIISLGLADWMSKNHPSFNFYVLPTRGWELLAGSILAYFEITNGKRSENKILNLILPSVGLFLIIFNITFFKFYFRHPSLYTLPAIIGVCLIIWFSDKNEIIKKIISTKLFVGIGLISYSLYLWHYPIFAFARMTGFIENNSFNKLLLILVALILATISYRFIEKPFRSKKFLFKKLLIIIIIIFLSIGLFGFYIISKNGKISFAYKKIENIYLKNNILNDLLMQESWKYVNNYNHQEFKFNNKIKILIVGDSHSKDLFNIFIQNKDLFKEYEFIRYGNDGMKNSLNFSNSTGEKEFLKFSSSLVFRQSDIILVSNHYNNIEKFNKLEIFLNKFKNVKKIILTSNANIYFTPKKFSTLSLTLFDSYLIKKNHNKKFIDKNLDTNEILKINKNYFLNRDKEKIKRINNKLIQIAKKYNILLLFKEDFQCNLDNEICYGANKNGMKLHYDYGHYTLEGAKFFGEKIFEINWLKLSSF